MAGDRDADPMRRVGLGRLVRDGLLVLVVLAMGLPFLVGAVGGEDLDADEEEAARRVRRAAYRQQDLLSNSLAHKVVSVSDMPDGIRIRERYYTFFGIPWGWSEGTAEPEGEVLDLETGLTFSGVF